MNARWGNAEWISQNVPAGEPCPLVQDSRFIGWACGGTNATKARLFLKSPMRPRSLWPEWDHISAAGWPVRGVFEPINEFEVPLWNLTKGTTRDDDEAWD